jgi:hypothetical protein
MLGLWLTVAAVVVLAATLAHLRWAILYGSPLGNGDLPVSGLGLITAGALMGGAITSWAMP